MLVVVVVLVLFTYVEISIPNVLLCVVCGRCTVNDRKVVVIQSLTSLCEDVVFYFHQAKIVHFPCVVVVNMNVLAIERILC